MENLIKQENLEDIREFIESKIADIPGEAILLGALGTLLVASYLNKTGSTKAAAIIGQLSIPIVGIGLAKYKDILKTQIDTFQETAEQGFA